MIVRVKGITINTEAIDFVTDIDTDCELYYDENKREYINVCKYFFQVVMSSGQFTEIEDESEVKIKEYHKKVSDAV